MGLFIIQGTLNAQSTRDHDDGTCGNEIWPDNNKPAGAIDRLQVNLTHLCSDCGNRTDIAGHTGQVSHCALIGFRKSDIIALDNDHMVTIDPQSNEDQFLWFDPEVQETTCDNTMPDISRQNGGPFTIDLESVYDDGEVYWLLMCSHSEGNRFLRLSFPEDNCSDMDSDGICDSEDDCPNDPNKGNPGICGCGVLDTDMDGDGIPDCLDQCPSDPNKTEPEQCGCGVADDDTDMDGVADCLDLCPNDPNKPEPGQCGCGVADDDTDNDGVPDCQDGCPNDPIKTEPGECGCGMLDIDTDNDGVPDCQDGCPLDPDKQFPGLCGCGVADSGYPGCASMDLCPDDDNKTEPGDCGCGVADDDTDNDGLADCLDQCPSDPNKTEPGDCGCGVVDIDTDMDGFHDCHDGCPNDPNKSEPGDCGCGVVDTDTDNDGFHDCHDSCPNDPNKQFPGECGCGNIETIDCMQPAVPIPTISQWGLVILSLLFLIIGIMKVKESSESFSENQR